MTGRLHYFQAGSGAASCHAQDFGNLDPIRSCQSLFQLPAGPDLFLCTELELNGIELNWIEFFLAPM